MREKECQYIFQNLLRMSNNHKSNIMSTIFINELIEETPTCDTFSDLKDLREAYKNKLNSLEASTNESKNTTIVDRIRTIILTNLNDEKLILKTMCHYNKWTQERLLSSLNTRNWIQYQIVSVYKNVIDSVFGYKEHSKGVLKMTENSLDSIKIKSK